MRIAVTFLDPISSPFGTYYVDGDGNFLRWEHCRLINNQWYFEKLQNI